MSTEKYLRRLAESFPFFFAELWRAIDMPSPSMLQRDIADWLESGPRRRGIRAFRGASKTWITLAYCAWLLYRNSLGYPPKAKAGDERITLISKSEGHGRKSLHHIRQWIKQVPFLQHMQPDRKAGNRDTATHFDIPQAKWDRTPSLAVYGIEGMITGQRSTTLVPDDIETPENTVTVEQRQRLLDQVTEFENMIVPDGQIVYLGTPHHEESLYDHLDGIGYVFRTWPARYPTTEENVPNLSPTLQQRLDEQTNQPGDPVWPEYFDDEELKLREAHGRTVWLMQYMLVNDLGRAERYPLKLKDLIVFPVDRDKAPIHIAWGTNNGQGQSTRIEDVPSLGFGHDGLHAPIMFDKQWSPYKVSKMWIDPAKGETKEGDSIGYAVVGQLSSMLFVKCVDGLSGAPTQENLEALARIARDQRVQEIHVEDYALQSFFGKLLEPVVQRHFVEPGVDESLPDGWRSPVILTKPPTGSGMYKEQRIIGALEPLMNQHRLVIDQQAAANQRLQHQMTRITRQRGCLPNDDELDALANCCWLFEDVLDQDPHQSGQRERQRKIDAEIREMNEAMGWSKPQPRRWFQHH